MAQPFIAQIQIFGFNFAPVDYAFTNGQLMAISQNEALFALIGTTYGGDGQTTFGLPNVQNNAVVNIGQGPGLSNYDLGQTVGADNITLNGNQMTAHTHQVYISAGTAKELTPTANGWFGKTSAPVRMYTNQAKTGIFALNMISSTGGNLPHPNQQPYLGMNFCIALYGIFPSRN